FDVPVDPVNSSHTDLQVDRCHTTDDGNTILRLLTGQRRALAPHTSPRRVHPNTRACPPNTQACPPQYPRLSAPTPDTRRPKSHYVDTKQANISHSETKQCFFDSGCLELGSRGWGTMANWRDEVGAGESWDESSRPSTFRVRRFQSLRSREAPRLHSFSEDQLSGKPISEMLRFGITINDSSISSLTFEDQDAPGETRCSRKLIIVNAP